MKKFISDFILPTAFIAILMQLFFWIAIPTSSNSFLVFLEFASIAGFFYYLSIHIKKTYFFISLTLLFLSALIFSVVDYSIGGDAIAGMVSIEVGIASVIGLWVRKIRSNIEILLSRQGR
jgi:uncharacterized membrane protein YccC